MKPRTKLQKRVFAISENLPKITESQNKWAFANCLEHQAYRAKKNTHCLDCGHVWLSDHKVTGTCVCPSCKVKLTIKDTRQKVTAQKVYAVMLDVVDGFQINRFFDIYGYYKAGTKAKISITEVVQQFINPDGKDMVVARNYGMMGSYTDHFSGYLEIRDEDHLRGKFNLYAAFTFPNPTYWPVYGRNGFTGDFNGCAPYSLFYDILNSAKTETLLKAGQYSLLRAGNRTYEGDKKISRYWDSIKICMRNGYIVEDAGIWFDTLDALSYLGKDLRNALYVCPADLKLAHDEYIERMRAQRHREQEERNRRTQQEVENDRQLAKQRRELFAGTVFKKGDITIRVLVTIEEFKEEGEVLHHCVYKSGYYNKRDSLILSACVNGTRMETIELIISEMRIAQSRGFSNDPTPHHNDIVRVMKGNIGKIKKKLKEANLLVAA